MTPEDDLANDAAAYRFRAGVARLQAAMLDFAAVTAEATIGMQRFAAALQGAEEWPDVVLEDTLDAEYIADHG